MKKVVLFCLLGVWLMLTGCASGKTQDDQGVVSEMVEVMDSEETTQVVADEETAQVVASEETARVVANDETVQDVNSDDVAVEEEPTVEVSTSSEVISDEKENGEESEVSNTEEVKGEGPILTYLGHSSIRIKTAAGVVIYIDPAYGDDYSEAADYVLVTHSHDDHNKINKISNKDYTLIKASDVLDKEGYKTLTFEGLTIEGVAAYNGNHNKANCVGFVLTFDGLSLYHGGDTSKTDEMANLTDRQLDYALLPCDGVYNMGPKEASECAAIINAKHNIPIHTGSFGTFSDKNAESFEGNNKIILHNGDVLALEKAE